MKKHWKLIVGILFLLGGIGCVTTDFGAFAFGIVVGGALIAWEVLPQINSKQNPNSSVQRTGYTYVGSTDSNKFHLPSCPYAKKIPRNKQVWFKTKAEAESRGYKPCEKCRII